MRDYKNTPDQFDRDPAPSVTSQIILAIVVAAAFAAALFLLDPTL